jgi:hypothetical protein
MDCGGCIRSGYRLVALPGGGFCVIPCGSGPAPPVPVPPEITVSGDTGDPTGMTVRLTVTNSDGPVTVDWGDGSPTEFIGSGESVTHVYAEEGTYTIRVTSVSNPELSSQDTVEVPLIHPMTWAGVKSTWPTWGAIDVPTWTDLMNSTPTP